MKRLSITRRPGWYGKLRALALLVDGVKVAELAERDSVVIEVSERAEFLTGKMDWAAGPNFSLQEMDDGDEIVVRTYFTLNILRMFGVTSLPLKIERVSYQL